MLLACILSASALWEEDKRTTIFMIGDSTMADKRLDGGNIERGWGQMLPFLLPEDVRVENHAADGRSSLSFIREGRWDTVWSRLKEGDYVFIQFGHNDEKPDAGLHTLPGGSFDENLRRFVREARAKGAVPVLFSPIARRNYPPAGVTEFHYVYETEGDSLVDSHGAYRDVAAHVAREMDVPFVDANRLTTEWLDGLGPENSKQFFMWVPAGKYAFCPAGKMDNTHLNVEGAAMVASLLMEEVARVVPRLAGCIHPRPRSFRLEGDRPVRVSCLPDEAEVVHTALSLLSRDVGQVLGDTVVTDAGAGDILVSTLRPGMELVFPEAGLSELRGKRQAFRIKALPSGRLLVVGSDSHGTAYGLMELSRLLGVSPWEWWADVMPERKLSFELPAGYADLQYPSVEYRGIFINDEDWGLMPWSGTCYEPGGEKGRIGPRTNARVFELLLRLRANLYWPAMHECTVPFFLTEGNREMAEKFGIYVGGSHCEPMACSTAGEWPRRGAGDYDYVNNAAAVRRFWEYRVREVAGQEVVYTLGMRGVHDGQMQGAGTVEDQKAVLERVIRDQRDLLRQYVDSDVTRVPQVFIPYKEVLDVYRAGLRVPDDVTLMWCDDNYGYIRHFPTPEERARKGGNGIYYHVSYWGRPHDYLWLGTFSPFLLFQQMRLAYDRGIRKMWVLNVGDIKPAEYQTELFLDMAWNIGQVVHEGVSAHLQGFLEREFGREAGKALLPVMEEHYRLAYVRKPEFMGNTRVEEWGNASAGVVKDLPWSREYIKERINAYDRLAREVGRWPPQVDSVRRDAYFQLVQYPVQAAAEMNKKLLYAQLARHGEADWNLSDRAYDSVVVLTRRYNALGGGKWAGIMDFRPRRLPVFDTVRHETVAGGLPESRHPLFCWDGADCAGGRYVPCEGLGYGGKAVSVAKGDGISFSFRFSGADSVEVEVRLLPNHPVEGGRLRFMLSLDGVDSASMDYSTSGRSEEWKENVLRNQAVRRVALPLGGGRRHSLSFRALDEGVVLDRIAVYAPGTGLPLER